MRKLIKKIFAGSPLAIILLSGLSFSVSAQTVVFYFVAPRATISAGFSATMDSLYCPMGYARTEITAANVATFRSQAPPKILYVYNQLQAGTTLRNNVNLVLRNSAGSVVRVEYWLADDRTGLSSSPADTSQIFMKYTDHGRKYVWPAANNGPYPDGRRFDGWVMFGEHQLETDQSRRTGGMRAVDEVVLHETSHTQFTGPWSKWGAVSGNAITYGADGMHYFSISELLGDQEGALNEGLATFYGFIMNDSALQKLMTEFTSTGYRYFVEGRSVLAGARELYTVADRRRTTLTDGEGHAQQYEGGGDITIFAYKWKDVPGFYLLFAESTSTAFFSIFRNQSYQNKDTALSMIRYTSTAMSPERRKRFLSYACNRIALKMEEYNNSAAGRADASRISSLFPFAVLDLVTHFGMTDDEFQADYRRNYADRDPRAFAEYFTRRAAIRALVQADINADPIRFDQALQSIINYCKQPANIL
ncbi:MAG: hypothetical protein HZA79_08095 [Sphingobacteriales bacterium]|nr:hypothetical protein [Sphingobacteriales bacterium]